MRKNSIWYLNPVYIVFLLFLIINVSFFVIDDYSFFIISRSVKQGGAAFFLYSLFSVSLFCFGALAAARMGRRRGKLDLRDRDSYYTLEGTIFKLNLFFFLLSALGYAVWFLIMIKNSGSLSNLLGAYLANEESIGVFRKMYVKTVPGVTTMTQFGMVSSVLSGIIISNTKDRRKKVYSKAFLVSLLLLAISRMLLNAERLGLIEYLVPFMAIIILYRFDEDKNRLMMRLAPIGALGGLLCIFTWSESLRSWRYYQHIYDGGLLEYSINRFSMYYTTTLNNASYIFNNGLGQYTPVYSALEFFWKFPGLSSLFNYESIFNVNFKDAVGALLNSGELNPEYNIFGVIGTLILDFGAVTVPIILLIFGIITGSLYRRFVNKNLLGLLLYPTWFIGVLEFFRIYYWTSSRYFPAVVSSLFCYLIILKASRRKPLSEFGGGEVS